MQPKRIFKPLIHCLGYVLLQILVAKHLVLFEITFCFVYIAGLLLWPIQGHLIGQLGLGFIIGFLIDLQDHTWGIHAFATVVLVYVRAFLLTWLMPHEEDDLHTLPTIHVMGWLYYNVYACVLIFLHHGLIFILDACPVACFWSTLGPKILSSSALTYVVLLIWQLVFYPKKRSKFWV